MQATGFTSEGDFVLRNLKRVPSHFDSLPLGKKQRATRLGLRTWEHHGCVCGVLGSRYKFSAMMKVSVCVCVCGL